MKAVLGSTVFLLFNSLFLGSAFAQSYDVSGVQILMTPDQVKTALSANGYQPGPAENFSQPSFDSQVKGKVTGLRNMNRDEQRQYTKQPYGLTLDPGRVVQSLAFQKDGKRETVLVEFTAFPSGARASKVTYKLDDSKISTSDFRAKVVEKYGNPNAGRAYVGDELLSQDNIEGKEVLNVTLNRITLLHKNYSSYKKAFRAAVEKAKQSSNPKSGKNGGAAVNKGTSF